MKKTLYKLLFAAFFTALILCACKNNVQPDNSLQITKDSGNRLFLGGFPPVSVPFFAHFI